MVPTTCTSPIVSSELIRHPSIRIVKKLRRKHHKTSIRHQYLIEMKTCKKITISTLMRT